MEAWGSTAGTARGQAAKCRRTCAVAWALGPRIRRTAHRGHLGHMERPVQAGHPRFPRDTLAPRGSGCTTTKLRRWRPRTTLACTAMARHRIRTSARRDTDIARGTGKRRLQLPAVEAEEQSGMGLQVAAIEAKPMAEVQAVGEAAAAGAARPGQQEIKAAAVAMEEAVPVGLGPRAGVRAVPVEAAVAMVLDCAARQTVVVLWWHQARVTRQT